MAEDARERALVALRALAQAAETARRKSGPALERRGAQQAAEAHDSAALACARARVELRAALTELGSAAPASRLARYFDACLCAVALLERQASARASALR
jgi:hypothetical protein